MEFRPGSLSARIAEAIQAGKNYEQIKKDLKLTNDFTFYSVRRKLGIARKQKSPRKPKGSEVIRIEAIFHSADGEKYRILSPPREFLSIFNVLMGGK